MLPRRRQPLVERPARAIEQRDVGAARGEKVGVGEKPPFRTRVGHAQPRHQFGVGKIENGVLYVGVAAQQALEFGEGRALDDQQRRLRDIARVSFDNNCGSVIPASIS